MANKLTVAEKKKRAWFLYLGGFSYRAIAKELKCGKTTIEKYIKENLHEYLETNKQEIEDIRQKENLKLDYLEQRVTKKFSTTNANDKDIEKLTQEVKIKLDISNHRRKLLGLEKIVIDDNRNKDIDEISEFIKQVVSASSFGDEPSGN